MPVPRMAWWALAVLMAYYALSVIDRQILALLVQPIKADLGLSDTQISLIMGPAFFLSYSVFGLPAGWLSDRMSRRTVLYLGVTIWSLAAAGGGFATGFLVLFLCRCGVGAGEATLSPSAYSLLADQFPRRRLAFAMGVYQSALKLGSAIAFGLGAYLIHAAGDLTRDVPWLRQFEPWQLVLILTGGPGIFLAPLVFTLREKRPGGPAEKPQHDLSDLMRFLKANASLLLLLSIGFACITAASNALTSWTPAYVERQFGWSPTRSGPWLGAMSLATSIVLVFKGGIIDWLYNRGMPDAHVRFYTWLAIGSFPMVLGLFWIPRAEVFLVGYGLLQILTLTFMVFLVPAIQIFTPPHLRGQVTAAFLFVFALFGSIGPVTVGLITDFVLRDEQRLGVSLAIVVPAFILATIVLLRLSLPRLRAAMEAAVREPTQQARL